MKRIYQGNYYQIDKSGNNLPFLFRMEVELDKNFSFNGTVWEEEFTEMSGKHLSVKGFIDNDHISFVKQYPCLYKIDEKWKVNIDVSKRGHAVIYDGYWDESIGSWIGEWEVEGESEFLLFGRIRTEIFIGNFEMKQLELV